MKLYNTLSLRAATAITLLAQLSALTAFAARDSEETANKFFLPRNMTIASSETNDDTNYRPVAQITEIERSFTYFRSQIAERIPRRNADLNAIYLSVQSLRLSASQYEQKAEAFRKLSINGVTAPQAKYYNDQADGSHATAQQYADQAANEQKKLERFAHERDLSAAAVQGFDSFNWRLNYLKTHLRFTGNPSSDLRALDNLIASLGNNVQGMFPNATDSFQKRNFVGRIFKKSLQELEAASITNSAGNSFDSEAVFYKLLLCIKAHLTIQSLQGGGGKVASTSAMAPAAADEKRVPLKPFIEKKPASEKGTASKASAPKAPAKKTAKTPEASPGADDLEKLLLRKLPDTPGM